MIKRLQNRVSESRWLLPGALAYAVVVWLVAGAVQGQWLLQFLLFLGAVYLMLWMNNQNLLIRVYSRAVSSAYIVLMCAASLLFPSLEGMLSQTSVVASLLMLWMGYQDKASMGTVYYAFAFLSLGSLVGDVRLLYYVPVYWLIMGIGMYSMSMRTFWASVLGIATPYSFGFAWLLADGGGWGAMRWARCLEPLLSVGFSQDYGTLGLEVQILFLLLILLFVIGTVHFLRTSYLDKIRVRQIYYCLIILAVWSLALTVIQPQMCRSTLHMVIVSVSPLIAHFVVLTNTRATNIVFCALTVLTLTVTVLCLWM